MIIASDLDRTLVYSERSLLEYGWPPDRKLIPVEFRNGKPAGYMSEQAYKILVNLCRHCLLVPVTARTTEQYNRFTIFQGPLRPRYAITANGAEVLYMGKPLKDWAEIISRQLKYESASKIELLLEIEKEGIKLNGQLKQAEDFFFYYILETYPSASVLDALGVLAKTQGWRISLQGRKLYFVPLAINKGAALKFVSSCTNKELLAGAGDSTFDWDFLQYCSHRFVPNHGILASVSISSRLELTKQKGILAGEEILERFLALAGPKIQLILEKTAENNKI
jgi:hypothetical protein